MRSFGGIQLISDRIQDETTTLTFHHLLENHELGGRIYCFTEDFVTETVKVHISLLGIKMRQCTMVDVTLIEAPSPTKYKEGKR